MNLAKRDPKPWSSRLRDGRLRVQCQACYEAGLQPSESVRDCTRCWERARRKRSEMGKFRALVAQAEDQAVNVDSP